MKTALRRTARAFERVLLRLRPLVMYVICLVVIALAILIQRNNENNEKTRNAVDSLSREVTEIRTEIDHLERFVDDLEEQTPDEQARNDAITEAVQQVPEIRGILCEQFPAATACQTP